MGMLAAMNTDSNVETPTDYTGGSKILPTGIYALLVDVAYLIVTEKGSYGLTLHLKTETGHIHKQTVYMTTNKANGCKNTYVSKRDNKTYFMPGFLLADSLAWLTLGCQLDDLDTEKKMVDKWDYELKKEIATEVDMVEALRGQEIWGAIEEQIVDKTIKQGNEYVPNGETRNVNELVRFYRASDKMTKVEIDAELSEPVNHDKWLEVNAGNVRNRSVGATANAGVAGAPAANSSKSKAVFGGKKAASK